jgi:hypothetical protein
VSRNAPAMDSSMSMAEHNSEYLYKIAVTGKNIIQDGREF